MLRNDLNITKATLVIENSFGFVVTRQVKVQRSEIEPASLVLQYIIKGERAVRAMRFCNQIAIVEGWVNVNGAINTSDGEHTSFDSKKFDAVVSGIDDQIVYRQ